MDLDKTPELLFEFVRGIIYKPEDAALDADALEEDWRQLGKGLLYLADMLKVQGEFARALARGDLSVSVETNGMNAPLKALQAGLRHLTWQSQQVAKGDYKQRVDFMGEFSDAFNTMVEKLDLQRASLEREIDFSHRKTAALLRGKLLLTNITANIPEPIFVLNKANWAMLYHNHAATATQKDFDSVKDSLMALIRNEDAEHAGEHHEIMLYARDGGRHYFSVVTYTLDWEGTSAVAFLLADVSGDKERVLQLERHAYQDPLTGLRNRFYGMKTLNEWIVGRRQFALGFVDLDFLKYINDTFTHNEGDKYILYAARLLEGFSRDACVCRIGGDEFLVLAPDYTYDSAEARFRELRLEMDAYSRGNNRPYAYGMSYGVVEIAKGNRMSPSDALGLADERMYEYKREGKKARAGIPGYRDDRLPPAKPDGEQ